MAGVISISSDEELSPDDTQQPKKKQKIEPVIYFDVGEEKKLNKGDEDNILANELDDLCNGNDDNRNKVENKSPSESTLGSETSDDDVMIESDDAKQSTSKISPVNEVTEIDYETTEGTSAEQNDLAKMFEKNTKMQVFLNSCISKIDSKKTMNLFMSKISSCKKLFDKIRDDYIKSDEFNVFLDDKITSSKVSSLVAISSFNEVYQHLKNILRCESNGTDLPNENLTIIAKLEHALRKVQKVVVKLEEAEVNFDEEEDSSYLKMQRYRERAIKIYEKICKYKKEDAKASYMLYNRLDFSGSNYSDFNHAINRKFKNNSVFPTYYELERCLKRAVKNKNMTLSENEFKEEARDCFKNLGNLLQKRRKRDLLHAHSFYLVTSDDPAFEDDALDNKLKTNAKDASSKIDDICQKYVKLQESGADPSLSSDSDDSKRESTDDEEDDDNQ